MKTHNLEPDGNKAGAIARGRVGTRAGTPGSTWSDDAGSPEVTAPRVHVIGGVVTEGEIEGEDAVILAITGSGSGGGETVVGVVTPDTTTSTTFSAETDHEAFPGIAWLDDPAAAVHGVGDRFIVVYRRASSHLTNGRTVAKIGTITSVLPWTYSLGTMFTIEDIADDVRVDDGVSVLDIGGGAYHAVVLCREYDGTANHAPHVHICDDTSETMTSSSTWTRHEIALSGHDQDLGAGRVIQLQDGTYACAAYHLTGATSTTCIIKTSTITDWSAPTIVNISAGYTEIDIEQVEDGTLFANMRNAADTHIFSSASLDNGATWSTPVSLFPGTHFPTWRVLTSGIGLITYADTSGFDMSYRQTTSGNTNTGWGAETILDPEPTTTGNYASLLQLDNNHVLMVYGVEATGIPDPVFSDLYTIVFTDSSVVGTAEDIAALDDLSDVTITFPAENDTLRYIGGVWVNDNRRWEPVTNNPGSGPELVWDGDDLVYHWTEY